MGDVNVTDFPDLHITQVKGIEPLKIHEVKGIEPIKIHEVSHIAPAAIHVKELNHIDPITVDSLRVDEVRHIDPISVERFDVTHLPTVNVSLSRVPTMDLNVRRIPPVAIALRQRLVMPSQYTIHATMFGVEVLRLNLHGKMVIEPCDIVPRERSRTHSRSYPEVAAVGNPCIPSRPVVSHRSPVNAGRPQFAFALADGAHK